LVIFVTIGVIAIFIYLNEKQTIIIEKITEPSTIVLRKLHSQNGIHALKIIGRGQLDGEAEISLILSGKPYKTEKLSRQINFEWSGDWYDDSATLEYKPSSAKKGSLKLEYEFEDFW